MSNELTTMQSQGGIVSMAIDSLTTQVLQNADDGVALSVLDVELVESVVNASKSAQGFQRATLYWIRQKKGYLILGYESFEAFGLAEFGLEKAYLHQSANAYAIEKSLGESAIADNKQIPEGQLRPLSPIPENERAAIWEEANRKAEEVGKERTAKMVQDAVNEWKQKHDSIQSDLLTTKTALQNKTLSLEAFKQQNNELRDEITASVDAKVNERIASERAALILENSNAIQQVERERDNIANEFERLKREQAKAIKDGVTSELNKLDTEVSQKRYAFERIEREYNELQKAKEELDAEVGAIAIHKSSINQIKSDLTSLTLKFSDAFDTNVIPTEVVGEWDAIYFALSSLKKQMTEWRDNKAPLEVKALEGELLPTN